MVQERLQGTCMLSRVQNSIFCFMQFFVVEQFAHTSFIHLINNSALTFQCTCIYFHNSI